MRAIKADLHNHLRTTSHWREGDFNRALDIAERRLGVGGVFGLVDFSDTRYETFSELPGYEREFVGEGQSAIYVPERAILIIRGQEVPTKQGHLLVLGLPKNVHLKERKDLEETMKEARDNGGVLVADHGFYLEGIGPYIRGKPELTRQLDAVETFNANAELWLPGLTPRFANRAAKGFYYIDSVRASGNLLQGALSCSDGHSFYELATCWTALDMPDDYRTFNVNEFRTSVQHAPSIGVWAPNQETPQRIAALAHILTVYACAYSQKLPNSVQKVLGVEK